MSGFRMLMNVEFRDVGKFKDRLKTKIINKTITKVVSIIEGYEPSDEVMFVMLDDYKEEYINALTSYAYTDSGLVRKNITYILQKARGRNPNPEGSFNREDAEFWVKQSTSLQLQESGIKRVKRKPSAKISENTYTKLGKYVITSSLRVVNKVLASLEAGDVSWVGKTENIKRLLLHEANEGYIANRISMTERQEIIDFVNSSKNLDRDAPARPYMATAIKTAKKKYTNKWSGMIVEEMKKKLRDRFKLKEFEIKITQKNTNIYLDRKLG